MHSMKFLKVKRYYDAGYWNKEMVRNTVVKGWISDAEFAEITGDNY